MTGPLFADLEAARDLARGAGDALLADLGRAGAAESKSGTEFVTEADRRAEDLLIAGLRDRFPGDHILTEEAGSLEGDSGRTWYVDPLDGTTNFAHGYPFFAVSLACGDAAGVLLGAVYAPYLDEMYLAVKGGGAVLERPRHETRTVLKRPGPVELSAALLATGFPYERDEIVDRNTALVNAFLKAPCHGVRRAGSAAIDLCHVAAGRLDGYWEFKLRAWDTAAGTLVAREAGAHHEHPGRPRGAARPDGPDPDRGRWRVSTGLSVFVSTFPSRGEAERVAEVLVDAGLAVCAQVGADLTSFFRWDGQLEKEDEVAVAFKVLDERRDLFMGELDLQHPYDVPQILGWPVAVASGDYLKWARSGGAKGKP